MIQAPIINKDNKDAPFYFVAIPRQIGSYGTTFNNYLIHCDPRPLNAVASDEYQRRFHKLFAFNSNKHEFLTRLKNSSDAGLSHGAAIFKGGYGSPNSQEIMVSPCLNQADPHHAHNASNGHLYAFVQANNNSKDPVQLEKIQSFWYGVGQTAKTMFDGQNIKNIDGILVPDSQLYLNTHGQIPYLHFRVETDPLHYVHMPELIDKQNNLKFYNDYF
jgi:hypothetical protein